jgi:hypothetical protein
MIHILTVAAAAASHVQGIASPIANLRATAVRVAPPPGGGRTLPTARTVRHKDLATLGRERLPPSLIGPDLMPRATHRAFPALAGVPSGFGRRESERLWCRFEIRDAKSTHWSRL